MDNNREIAPTAFQAYWLAYCGLNTLLKSQYFWLSIGFAIFLVPAWDVREKTTVPWVSVAFQILPSVVSFSLGAMAIILSISSGMFLKIIQQNGRGDSFFMKVIAAFFHFIFVQFLALFAAIFCNYYVFLWSSLFGFWLFIYSLACGVAAAAALVDVALIRNKASGID